MLDAPPLSLPLLHDDSAGRSERCSQDLVCKAVPGESGPKAVITFNHSILPSSLYLIREVKGVLPLSRSVQRRTGILDQAPLPQEHQSLSGHFSAHFAQLGASQKSLVSIAFLRPLSFLSVLSFLREHPRNSP